MKSTALLTGKLIAVLLFISVSSCSVNKKLSSKDDDRLQLTIVQVNDVYEIAPLSGGAYGGLARIATIKKEELKSNPNTLLVIAGDFLSPSVYNSLRYEGRKIRGRQMVDAMNAACFDIAVFGNHEFDITRDELHQRLDESKFQWISSNCFEKTGDHIAPFYRQENGRKDTLPAYKIMTFTDADGTTAKVGFIGINIPANAAAYVQYANPLTTAENIYNRIKDSCDIVIPITHQTIQSDSILAIKLPQVPVIIGGHEHDMRFKKVGNVYITKAHANARTAFIIKIDIDKRNKTFRAHPELKPLDVSVPLDSSVSVVVEKWKKIANDNYSSLGFDPSKIVMQQGDSLDGRDTPTRDHPTNLTGLIVKAMAFACPDADIAILNSGSIRLDDILYPPISQYDILRTLPFGGSIREVEMKGSLLKQVLDIGQSNRGSGGYLDHTPLAAIDTLRTYHVALPDFLLNGGEKNLGFLTPKNPLITRVYPEETGNTDPRSDIRLAVVVYLSKGK